MKSQVTVLTKNGGPLTKRIHLAGDGLANDTSGCVMTHGRARRFEIATARQLAELIGGLQDDRAITLGALRPGLADEVEVVTKRRLGEPRPDLAARTSEYFAYRPGEVAWALLDYDLKGAPAALLQQLDAAGGLWAVLVSIVPGLADTARVRRLSTSAGLYRTDTGERFSHSGGQHIYVAVRDGTDIERFLKTLHDRCWLAGFGWMNIGAGGQLLERSIVDRVVGGPERLVFEGAPLIEEPLAQDPKQRRPVAVEGGALDTVEACPPLTVVELARLRERRAKERLRLAPESAKAREVFIAEQSEKLVERTDMTRDRARRTIARQCAGILLPDVVLPFDDKDLAGKTVAHVLAAPVEFEGATLADPLEGVGYGVCKAKVMLRADGTPWIHSFAHGRTVYELRFDHRAAVAGIDGGPPAEATDRFLHYALGGDLSAAEVEQLKARTAKVCGVGYRALGAMLNRARQERNARTAEEERDRVLAARCDPRPQVPAPHFEDSPLPQMGILNDVLGASRAAEPPMRNADLVIAQGRATRLPSLHALTTREANREATSETRLPAPEQLMIVPLNEMELTELIERHIEYVNATGRPVRLHPVFVKSYLRRDDNALPLVTSIAQLPIVLYDGTVLTGGGLNRRYGILFRVPVELQELLPRRAECTREMVRKEMNYLINDWLVDVAADYAGKCVVIACALTILERALLPQRPAFFITAGQRGGGKTTTIQMISTAARGLPASAAAWSPSEEERRKALFSYLGAGLDLLVWDNVPRGSTISCASIEKSLTSEFYSDRVLSENRVKTVPASTVQVFTGNNITPRGDLASRSLTARLTVNLTDPENRKFKHTDPIGWTDANRGRILRALYTVLLGNPRRSSKEERQKAAPTRFKEWWDMVGSAVEHAAECHLDPPADPQKRTVDFKKMFLSGEGEEEQTSALATVIEKLNSFGKFSASDVSLYAGKAEEGSIAFKDALELASGKSIKIISSTTISWRLKAITDAPVAIGDKTMVLRYAAEHQGGSFKVETLK